MTDALHHISLAIWDVESPIIVGRRSTMKIGARCSEGCALAGVVELRNEQDVLIGSSPLGLEPWSGTTALYWSELHFEAPPTEGSHMWTAVLRSGASELPHPISTTRVSMLTAGVGECLLALKIVEKGTEAPMEDVEVRLGGYRCRTGESGCATLELPKGIYDIGVYKLGYHATPTSIDVTGNIDLQIEIEPEPELEQEYWK